MSTPDYVITAMARAAVTAAEMQALFESEDIPESYTDEIDPLTVRQNANRLMDATALVLNWINCTSTMENVAMSHIFIMLEQFNHFTRLQPPGTEVEVVLLHKLCTLLSIRISTSLPKHQPECYHEWISTINALSGKQ